MGALVTRRRLRMAGIAAVLLACGKSGPVTTVPVPVEPIGAGARPIPPPPPPPVVIAPPVARPPVPPAPSAPVPRRDPTTSIIRVAILTAATQVRLSAAGTWILLDSDGVTLLANGGPAEAWEVTRQGRRLRGSSTNGVRSAVSDGPWVARATTPDGFLTVDGKRYRGEIGFFASDTGVVVVNRLLMDDYLAGVVPLEIGPRTPAESAAVQAQAVGARSYAFVKIDAPRNASYDLVGTVFDQVYGGVDAETPSATAAVQSTRGLVLLYAGRVVNAPYSAVCGGTTAEQQDVWRAPQEPYLKRVSDRVPGTDRHYCDISPRFSFTRTFTSAEVDAVIARYLSQYVTVPAGGAGHVRRVGIESRTPGGRVAVLSVSAERGTFELLANDIRFVFRNPAGEILGSTNFSVETTAGSDGGLASLTFRGTGFGHGIGMCQWGAIGRARAGQDFRTILTTYYQGTTVGLAP
jgi:stage II sporulation protein D